MPKNSKSMLDRTNAAAIKEERLRDRELALREYELGQSAVLLNMRRLRAARLLRQNEPPVELDAKPSADKKASADKKKPKKTKGS
jgi:hypothetical protein